jgi:hypothetical protein
MWDDYSYLFWRASNIETRKSSCEIRKLGFQIAYKSRCKGVDFFEVVHGCEEKLERIFLILIQLDGFGSSKCCGGDIQAE